MSRNACVRSFEIPGDATSWDIQVHSGVYFVIKIQGNITTGYDWLLSNYKALQKSGLVPLNLDEDGFSKDYVADRPVSFGSGGVFYFKFLSKYTTSEISLLFQEKRKWEESPARSVTVKVKIN